VTRRRIRRRRRQFLFVRKQVLRTQTLGPQPKVQKMPFIHVYPCLHTRIPQIHRLMNSYEVLLHKIHLKNCCSKWTCKPSFNVHVHVKDRPAPRPTPPLIHLPEYLKVKTSTNMNHKQFELQVTSQRWCDLLVECNVASCSWQQH
jgi:hypothetical protein